MATDMVSPETSNELTTGDRIALVIPWFGKDLKGGAEQQAYQIADRLRKRGCAIEVLTTCSQSFHHSWHKNHYRAGVYEEEGLCVRRFPVDQRNPERFNHVVARLLAIPPSCLIPGVSPLQTSEEAHYWNDNINSSALIDFLKIQRDKYRCFIFLPYLFPLTLRGVEAVGNKAFVQPCLHDECYAYLHQTARIFERCHKILFNSLGESILAQRLYGDWIATKSLVIGEGVELGLEEPTASPEGTGVEGPYVLYLGKRCAEKNTPLLIKAFDRFQSQHASKLKLVLAGSSPLPLTPKSAQVLDFGIVSPLHKEALLRNCQALLNPSVNESFSRVIFEAWHSGRPVAVHSDCLATYHALAESGGAGWSADSEESWAELFQTIATTPTSEITRMGQIGKAYATKTCDWDAVIDRYEELFASIPTPTPQTTRTAFIITSTSQPTAAERDEIELLCTYLQVGPQPAKPVLVARNPTAYSKDAKLAGCLIQTTAAPALLAAADDQALLIWVGEEEWPQATQWRRNFRGLQMFRPHFLSTQPRPEGFAGDLRTIAPLIKIEDLAHAKFDLAQYVRTNTNQPCVLVAWDRNDPTSRKVVGELGERFQKIYRKKLKFLFLTPAGVSVSSAAAQAASNSYESNLCFYDPQDAAALPLSQLKAADALLIIGTPDLPAQIAVAAQYFSTPVLTLASASWPKVLGEEALHFASTDEQDLSRLVATIRLCLQGGDLRDELISGGHANIKQFMHGKQKHEILTNLRPAPQQEA